MRLIKLIIISLLMLLIYATTTLINAQHLEPVSEILQNYKFESITKYTKYFYCPGPNGIQIISLDTNGEFSIDNKIEYKNNCWLGIKDNYLITVGDTLRIFDLEDPINPLLISEYDLPYFGSDILVIGDYVYIYASINIGYDDLSLFQIIDISNPLSPEFIGTLTHSGANNDMREYDTDNNFLCIVWDCSFWQGTSLMIAYDISNPANPTEICTYDPPYPHGVADVGIVDNYAYLLAGQHPAVYDLNTCEIIDTLEYLYLRNIRVEDNYAFYRYFEYLNIINIDNPLSPFIENTYNTYAGLHGFVESSDSLFYIAGQNDAYPTTAMCFLDIADASQPQVVSECQLPGRIPSIQYDDGYAYAASEYSGIWVIDLTGPGQPSVINHHRLRGACNSIAVFNDIACVTNTPHGLEIFNISHPNNIFPLSYIDNDFDEFRHVNIEGDRLYLSFYTHGVGEGISIIDISAPSEPDYIGVLLSENNVSCFEPFDSLVFIGAFEGGSRILRIYNVANPSEPTILSDTEINARCYDIEISGNYMLLSTSYGLFIYDIADLFNPIRVAQMDSINGNSLSICDNYGLVANSRGTGIFIIDISDLTEPDSLYYYEVSQAPTIIGKPIMADNDFFLVPMLNYVEILRFTPTGIEQVAQIPTTFSLSPNYPNPFNAQTTISYSLPQSSDVRLDIYDILGRKVQTLYDGPQAAGEHSFTWNAEGFVSGLYFYKITAGKYEQSEKMILLK